MALHYFLKVEGVNGDVTTKGFANWFAAVSFSIGESTPFSSGAGGVGAGKTQFAPLTIDIHSLAGLAPLFADEANNTSLKVELVAVETLKGKTQEVYDLKLTKAELSGITSSAGSNGIETALTFHYGTISLTDTPPGGKSRTFGFDLTKNLKLA